MEGSNVTETNREGGGVREWGAVRQADVQLPGLQKSCLFHGSVTPHSRKVSFGWKSRTRVLRSSIKGLNKPVFLTTGNRLLLFTIWR